MSEERSDELEAVKRDRARLIAELHGAHRERDSLLAELAAMTRYADAQVGASMRAATELRSLRGVVQAVEALAEKWADGDEVSEWNPLDELRAALGGSCVCGARPSSSPAALAAAADAPQPARDNPLLHDPRDGQCRHSGTRERSYPGYRCPICRPPSPAVLPQTETENDQR